MSDEKLNFETYRVYFCYMLTRFSQSTEDYHKEWYCRFKNKTAYLSSDKNGQYVLRDIVNNMVRLGILESTAKVEDF